MSFSIGIVGLPNVGKSTLFKALTKKKIDIAAYPFTTIHPNVGVVIVPDERLEKIAEIIKPEKVTPTVIEFIDIAGLVKGAHKGEGLGNQFLAHIRNCDAILEVVRTFNDPEVENVLGEINPEKEIEIIKVELLMKDLETLENLIKKLEKDAKSSSKIALKKIGIFEKIKASVSEGKLIADLDLTEEEKSEIQEYQFLTAKPKVLVLNINQKNVEFKGENFIPLNLKIEEEISELNPSELKELEISSSLDQLILKCYDILDLITFYTIAGGKETRAWTVMKGSRAPEAGGKVHSDFEGKFIKAEVISWDKLIEAGSRLEGRGSPGAAWPRTRELGWLKIVGKDHVVEDGDVIEFKI